MTLSIELLMRRAIIKQYDNHDQSEWPPHPDRVYMALVAAWSETGQEASQRAALEWLATLKPPTIAVSLETSERASFTSYVPVNDIEIKPANAPKETKASIKKYLALSDDEKQKEQEKRKKRFYSESRLVAAHSLLPENRLRQARTYPAVIPASPFIHLLWDVEPPDDLLLKLEKICAAVTYLGHSATPVRMWIDNTEHKPTLVPCDARAICRLRVFISDRLERLQKDYEAGQRPKAVKWAGYSLPLLEQTTVNSQDKPDPFDPGIFVLRHICGRNFGLQSCGLIAEAIRLELMRRNGPNAPEWISGHAPDGSVSKQPRPAYLPLGFVDSEFADGHLLGVAIVIPTDFEHVGRLHELLIQHDNPAQHGVPRLELLIMNPQVHDRIVGELVLELDERPEGKKPFNLKSWTWIHEAHVWRTVTPVVLPRFPRRQTSVEDVVVQACLESGYPEPETIRVNHAPFLQGVPHARSFHVKPRHGRPPRPLIHVELAFPVPVRGPVLIGAGRYAGYGAFRPNLEKDQS